MLPFFLAIGCTSGDTAPASAEAPEARDVLIFGVDGRPPTDARELAERGLQRSKRTPTDLSRPSKAGPRGAHRRRRSLAQSADGADPSGRSGSRALRADDGVAETGRRQGATGAACRTAPAELVGPRGDTGGIESATHLDAHPTAMAWLNAPADHEDRGGGARALPQ